MNSGNAILKSGAVLHTGKTALPIKAGQASTFKSKSGEHYRVLKGREGEEQLLDDVIAKRSGEDLILDYADGTQVVLENYYVECRAGDCDVIVPGKSGEVYKIDASSTAGVSLGDGSTMVYAHGSHDALMGLARGSTAMQTALGSHKGDCQVLTLGGYRKHRHPSAMGNPIYTALLMEAVRTDCALRFEEFSSSREKPVNWSLSARSMRQTSLWHPECHQRTSQTPSLKHGPKPSNWPLGWITGST
jgi:hypothetical protein